jgi:RNA polymerase sigma factor (TIGR02999 family)
MTRTDPGIGGEITGLLAQWRNGSAAAGSRAVAALYGRLRYLAAGMLGPRRSEQTLQPTALVNEGLLKLLENGAGFENRRHFVGTAARAMRQILVDRERRRRSAKCGEGRRVLDLESAMNVPVDDETMIAIDDALRALEKVDPRAVRIVELRFFAGLSIDETGRVLGLHPSAVNREWAHARAWLEREISR